MQVCMHLLETQALCMYRVALCSGGKSVQTPPERFQCFQNYPGVSTVMHVQGGFSGRELIVWKTCPQVERNSYLFQRRCIWWFSWKEQLWYWWRVFWWKVCLRPFTPDWFKKVRSLSSVSVYGSAVCRDTTGTAAFRGFTRGNFQVVFQKN